MSSYSNVKLGISHETGTMTISKQKLEWVERAPGTKKITIAASEIKHLEWLNIDKRQKLMRITFLDKPKEWVRFIGFGADDEIELDQICKKNLGKGLNAKTVNLSGQSWGQFVLRHHDMVCRTEEKHIIFTVPYHTISQSVIQARNEISIEFKPQRGEESKENRSPNKRKGGGGGAGDQLCEMRMFIPDDEDGAAYQEFNDTLKKKAKLQDDQNDLIAWFKNIVFKVPRGNKEIMFYSKHFKFRTDTFAYRISYKQIKRLFVFEQPGHRVSFLVDLSQGIRQGYQTYGFLIMEFPEDEKTDCKINATEQEMQTVYASKDGKRVLHKDMFGPTYEVISRVFMALSKIKIIAALKYESAEGYRCVQCSHGANQGLLYPLEKSIFFIHKPVIQIRHSDIAKLEMLRMEQSHNIKMFDVSIHLNRSQETKVFTGIDRAEYEKLIRYFMKKVPNAIGDRKLHEARLNNTMLSSSRSTRTRKNIKASAGGADISFAAKGVNLDDDDEDDDDYNMEDDAAMLEEDVDHDAKFEEITEKMTMSSGPEDDDVDERKRRKKKKERQRKEKVQEDAMIASDEDIDMQ